MVVHPHNRKCLRKKRYKLLTYATIWMNLQIILLSGKKDKMHILNNPEFVTLFCSDTNQISCCSGGARAETVGNRQSWGLMSMFITAVM